LAESLLLGILRQRAGKSGLRLRCRKLLKKNILSFFQKGVDADKAARIMPAPCHQTVINEWRTRGSIKFVSLATGRFGIGF
jgi:hypothetical protein